MLSVCSAGPGWVWLWLRALWTQPSCCCAWFLARWLWLRALWTQPSCCCAWFLPRDATSASRGVSGTNLEKSGVTAAIFLEGAPVLEQKRPGPESRVSRYRKPARILLDPGFEVSG